MKLLLTACGCSFKIFDKIQLVGKDLQGNVNRNQILRGRILVMSEAMNEPRFKNPSKMNKLTEEELKELEILEKKILGKEKGLLKVLEEEATKVSDEKEPEVRSEKKKHEVTASNDRKKPAWIDEDDSAINIPHKLKKYATVETEDTYEHLLRRKFEQTVGVPRWVEKLQSGQSTTGDDTNELMRRCGNMLEFKRGLMKGTLKIEKMEDLNQETKVEGPLINAVEFHPTSTVALIAGQSGIASIVQVDGITNSKLQTVKFRGFSIECAHFTSDGEQFIIGNRKTRHFWYYDMMEGRSVKVPIHNAHGIMNMSNFVMSPDGKFIAVCGMYGNVHLLCARTKEWICDLKMNANVVDITFNNDGSRMFSFSVNGEVYEWNMSTRSCVRKMFDDGCVQATSMTLSRNNQVLATGSNAGIVNLYEMPIKDGPMSPKKIIKNLVTPITAMAFNNSSEILAIASKEKHNAVRMIHFPSMTVFSNFPGFKEVGQPRVLSFSPLSGFFAIGNSQRNVLLYRLKYYKNY